MRGFIRSDYATALGLSNRIDLPGVIRTIPAAILLLVLLPAVAGAEWGPDIKLSAGETNAMLNENMGQCLIADGNNIHLVWTAVKNKDEAIYYKRSTDQGLTWGPEIRLSPAPSGDTFPLIAQSDSALHVVFLRNGRTPQAASFYKRSTDDGLTWGPEIELGKSKWWPGVTAVGSNVYVSLNTVFADDAKNSVVFFRRSGDDGVTWEAPQQISNAPRRTGGRAEDPAIVTDGQFIHMVWNDNREAEPGKGMSVCYRRSSDGGTTWGPETLLTHAPDYTYCPSISLDGPHVDIAYADRQTGHYHIFHLHSANFGATWEPKVQITKDSPDAEIYPAMARFGSDVHMVWIGKPGVMYQHSANGGRDWESATCVVLKDTMPFIALARDVVHVVFKSQRDGHGAIYYKRNPAGNPTQN